MSDKNTRYTAVFEFDGEGPEISREDGWNGGKLISIAFCDLKDENYRLRSALDIICRLSGGQMLTIFEAQEIAEAALDNLAET